jgi:hypothetical protein
MGAPHDPVQWWAQWWARSIRVRRYRANVVALSRGDLLRAPALMFAVGGGCAGVAREFVDLDLRAQNNDASCAH